MAAIQRINISLGQGSGAADKMGNNYPPPLNSTFTFTLYPAIGWRIKSVTLDNIALPDAINPTGNQTFTITGLVARTYYVVINFEEIPVAPPADDFREIEVQEGSKLCFHDLELEGEFVRLIAPAGKEFGFVQLNGSPITLTDTEEPVVWIPKGKNLITFCTLDLPPPPPHPANYTVTVLTNLNNTGVSPQTGTVVSGGSFSTVITPPSGYNIGGIKINNVDFTAFTPSGYTLNLTNILQNTTVVVTFVTLPPPPPSTQTLRAIWTSPGLGVTLKINNTDTAIINGQDLTIPSNVQVRFQIQLQAGYTWNRVERNGILASLTEGFSGGIAVYEFNAGTADQLIYFIANVPASPTVYNVAVFNQGSGSGSIVPNSATLAGGSSFSTTVTPNAGSFVHSAYIQGDSDFLSIPSTGGTITTTTKTNQNTVIFVRFDRFVYNVFVINGTNGNASSAGGSVNWGGTFVVSFTPNVNYEIDTITVNGVAQTVSNRDVMTLSLTNIQANATIVSTYRLKAVQKLKIFVSFGTVSNPNPSMASLVSSVSPNPPFVEVDTNTEQVLSAQTIANYQFGTVTLNGTQIHSGGTTFSYTIIAPQMTIDYYLVIQVIPIPVPNPL